MKTKRKRKKSWKPIRRGKVYCSPACGGGCTHAAYVKANKDAAMVRLTMRHPRNWKVHIWENLGWHWCVQAFDRKLSVRNGEDGKFSADLGLSGIGHWGTKKRHKTAQAAVDDVLLAAFNAVTESMKLVTTARIYGG